MKQQTLTSFEKFGKTTRRAQFLQDTDRIITWAELAAAVQKAYPKVSESGGRPPIPPEQMLRISFLQPWFNLSDPAAEEALPRSRLSVAEERKYFLPLNVVLEVNHTASAIEDFRHLFALHYPYASIVRIVQELTHDKTPIVCYLSRKISNVGV